MSTDNQSTLIARIQAQLHASAGRNMEPVSVPPFTCFFNSDSTSPWSNYAIPDEPVAGDASAALRQLCAEFQQRHCQPRFEHIAEYAPGLAQMLLDGGFDEESRTQLMLCTPDSWQRARALPELRIALITADDPLERIQALLDVQNRAFGDDTAGAARLCR